MTDATEERFSSTGGADIAFRSWKPAGAPRAVLVINHGVKSHSGHYLWPAAQFAARGLAVYAIDMRGRGKSGGERFYIQHVNDYVGDLTDLIRLAKSRHPGLPVFLLGHSAGGVVACSYALEHQQEIAGLICESFAFKVYAPDFALGIIKWLSGFAPRLKVLNLKNKDFSRDPAVVAFMDKDPLIHKEVQPAITVAALVRADERLQKEFPRITLPVFILHGTADKVTVPAGSQFFYNTTGAKDKTLKLYDGHAHDLLNDYGKEQVLAGMQNWIDARL